MADTVTSAVDLALLTTEVLDSADTPSANSVSDRTLRHNAFALSASLNVDNEPKISRLVTVVVTLGASAYELDLTAAPKSVGRTEDLTGLKVVGLLLQADPDNAAAITIAPGASDPYPLFGTGNELDLDPGETVAKCYASGTATAKAAVSGTVKQIDIDGTLGDVLNVQILLGP